MGTVQPAASRARPARPHPAFGRRRRHQPETAQRVGVSRPTVIACRRRYVRRGLDALPDRPRPGRPQTVRRLRRAEILSVTLNPPPARLGITHWSTRLLARELGVTRDTVARIWREYGVQPWRAETFKFSTDPELAAKVHDVVGLYLHPPDRAVVLCVDEKSQIQALARILELAPFSKRPGRIVGQAAGMVGRARVGVLPARW